jgi:hypothetical protein
MNEAEAYANYMGEGPYDDPPSPEDVDEAEDIERDGDDDDDFEGIKQDLEDVDD